MTNLPLETVSEKNGDVRSEMIKIFLPYALAVLVQLPMLILYFRALWTRPHYQPFSIAILATIALALYRWPFGQSQPFHRSITSDILLVMGFGSAFLGMLFVEPWFAAFSVMLLISSLFARTVDREKITTLWPCSLPLYVYLVLPQGMDTRLITTLQQYSAVYTSQLLDLVGLGHHMDGTVINVPSMKEYGIEQACSGVQSFFTLLLVSVVFIVMSRRLNVPTFGIAMLSILAAITCFILRMVLFSTGFLNEAFLIVGIGFLLWTAMGFRAAALILSAIFWAVFMNTIRILLIPLSDYFLQFDLATGFWHDILGYGSLALGILMLFSTDQFLLFLFGPVEETSGESGPFGRLITKFWNGILAGDQTPDENEGRRKKRSGRRAITKTGKTLIWTLAGFIIAFGLWEFVDVQRSYRSDLKIRFFDDDTLVDFEQDDIPEWVDSWKRIKYETQDRSTGSDLGQRSDVWQFANTGSASGSQSYSYSAVASLDQTFPGWHELTTCYKNTGWKLVSRKRHSPSHVTGEKGDDEDWPYIEATFERRGEKGYLLFSHFDAFGKGMEAPASWGTINSFFIRARNRLSHRIRAQLFQGEAYQTQVFLTTYSDFNDAFKKEIGNRYLTIRGQMRKRFEEKTAVGN